MKDKAGTEITVGCRVAETDLGFGDGTVESVEVPASGGFNVGVHWDKPEKDGPGWSDEGGGRGAEHLLVIEAAPTALGSLAQLTVFLVSSLKTHDTYGRA